MNWTQIKICLFFMTLFFCNYVICEEKGTSIDILSITKSDSYEIFGSIYEGKDVEWVALHSKLENHFNNKAIDQHDVFLYNVNARESPIILGMYKNVDLFDIFKNDQNLSVILHDQGSKGTYIFNVSISDGSIEKKVIFDNNYRIFDDGGGIIMQDKSSVHVKGESLELEDSDTKKLIGYGTDSGEHLLFKNQTHIFHCPIEDDKIICKFTMEFSDYILERGNIVIKNSSGYTFIPKTISESCKIGEEQVILDAIYVDGSWDCSIGSKVKNPFAKSHPIHSSRGLTEEHFGIFTNEYGTVVAHVKGNFCTPLKEPSPQDNPSSPNTEPEAPNTEPEAPNTEPEAPNSEKVTTPQSTERSATTWAIVVIVLIVLSGLAYIAWRYFRGNQPISNPFANENNI